MTELLAIEAAIEYIWESSGEEFMSITDSCHCFLLDAQPYWDTWERAAIDLIGLLFLNYLCCSRHMYLYVHCIVQHVIKFAT